MAFSVLFDGINDEITAADSASLDVSGSLTLECWANMDAFPGVWADIIAKGTTDNVYQIAINSSGAINAGIQKAVNTFVAYTTTATLSTGRWAHVAFVYNQVDLRIYINGALQDTPVAETAAIDTNAAPLRLMNGEDGFADGTLDEVRIWNIARTAAQIAAFRFEELSGTESGLVLYWRLDEGTGTSDTDRSGNSNTGTIAGGATWSQNTAPIGASRGLPLMGVG